MSKVFMSYRRDDSAAVSGRIYDRLVAQFGKANVFKDVDSIPPGVDYRDYLADIISQCDVQLTLIGRHWLDVTGADGRRRLDDPNDIVRFEVESAMEQGILIIPLLVDNAAMPAATKLPDTLVQLSRLNALPVRYDPDFDHDIHKVIAAVDQSKHTPRQMLRRTTIADHQAQKVTSHENAQALEAEGRTSVTVDVVLLTVRERRLEVLLVRRRHWPFEGMWAIPGGFVEPDESLEDSARREIAQEIGESDVYLEQLYVFGDPGRDPRMRVIAAVYYMLTRADQLHPRGSDDSDGAGWFPAYEHPPLAFDHDIILEYTRQRLRSKLEYTTIGFQLLAPSFTLSELQEVYEAILNRPLDKRNFRMKVLSTGILEQIPETRKAGQHRPAALYRFNPRADK